MFCNWFKFMFSIPRAEPMTRTEKFTQWSSLLAYCLGGGSFLVVPGLWKIILQLELQGRSEGYLRLAGLGVLVIGFLLIIAARSSHKIPGHGAILWSILGRLVYVNGVLLMMILRDMLPLSFALFFMALDSSLAVITLVIWYRETEGASVKIFCQEIWSPLCQCRGLKTSYSISTIFLMGVFQMLFYFVFAVKPDIAQNICHFDPFEGFSGGFLAAIFLTLSIHGSFHATNACNVNLCFSSASLFYRLALNVPVLVILLATDQIEQHLFVFLLGFDLVAFTVILLSLIVEKLTTTNTEKEESTALTTENND